MITLTELCEEVANLLESLEDVEITDYDDLSDKEIKDIKSEIDIKLDQLARTRARKE